MVTQGNTKLVAIVDDDDSMRSALQGLLQSAELPAQSFASAEEFLKSGQQHQIACLIADIRMPGMSGLELQVQWSLWQNRSTTKRCSRVFGPLWKVKPLVEACSAQGGSSWELSQHSGLSITTVVRAGSSRS